jgi:formylglycine-generating enzyme required for sulfatase activity
MPEQLDCDGDGTPECPDLPGHKVYCNGQNHCEYADSDPTGWKKWNVWIWVPPGAFLMGSPEGEYQWNVKEVPVHMVTVANGYWIGKFEVTVAQYQACMADVPDGCTPPLLPPEDWDGEGWGVNSSANGRSEHPQNTVTWEQAGNVCAWIAPSGRLPSEAEWEYAASGPVHRKYPWGDAPQPYCYLELAVFDDDGNGRPWGCVDCVAEGCSGTSPVGTMPKGASYVGALDMAGNVSEWCQDNWHDNYDGAPSDGSAWLGTSKHRVFRGGRFSNGPDDQRCAYRNHYTVASATTVVQGVRCAFSAQ